MVVSVVVGLRYTSIYVLSSCLIISRSRKRMLGKVIWNTN
jgi:hypothetical protein